MEETLSSACKSGNIHKVQTLLAKRETKESINNPVDILGYTPLHEATAIKAYKILELLLQNGANVNSIANGKYTALHIAASIDARKCIEVILRYDPDLKALDEYGRTPLASAGLNNNKKASQLLQTAGTLFITNQ